MNIRALVFSILSFGVLGYTSSACAMDDMASQQAMMMAMIKQMPEEKVREIAHNQFAGDMQVISANRAHNLRWAALETALALLLLDGTNQSTSRRAATYCLMTLGTFEVLGALANTVALWSLSSEQEALYRHLMNIRAGSQMYDEALDDDMLDA